MGILPSSQSYGKIMYMDPLEVGCTMWVNIGSCLLVSLLWVSEVLAWHVIVLAFRPEGIFIPDIGSHPGMFHS